MNENIYLYLYIFYIIIVCWFKILKSLNILTRMRMPHALSTNQAIVVIAFEVVLFNSHFSRLT